MTTTRQILDLAMRSLGATSLVSLAVQLQESPRALQRLYEGGRRPNPATSMRLLAAITRTPPPRGGRLSSDERRRFLRVVANGASPETVAVRLDASAHDIELWRYGEALSRELAFKALVFRTTGDLPQEDDGSVAKEPPVWRPARAARAYWPHGDTVERTPRMPSPHVRGQ